MPTETFTTATNWDIPSDVTEVIAEARGGRGEAGQDDSVPGDGGVVRGRLAVTPSGTLYIRFTAGGESGALGKFGGDGADVRQDGTALSDRDLVAGGGAASGRDGGIQSDAGDGGDGGANTGQTGGSTPNTSASGGGGGSQSDGGAGGTNGGQDGAFGVGGDGNVNNDGQTGGGGGGGWYGGGGGGTDLDGAAGGGGGSNYTNGLISVDANERGTSPRTTTQGEVLLEYVGTPQNVTVTLDGEDATLTWSDPTGVDEINIYRAGEAGVDTGGTPLATVTPGTETYTDAGLLDGKDYYYRLTATDSNGTVSGDSDEVSISTPLPAPTDLAVLDARASEADLSWTANHDNGETRIDLAEDDDGNWTEQTTVAYTVESVTLSGILNGQLYGVRVVAQTDDAETVDQ